MDIITKLIESGYTESQAHIVSDRLSQVDDIFKDGIQKWVSLGTNKEYSIDQITTLFLMKEYGLTYPAAILTLDWVRREPGAAKEAIKRGIR